jgi:hypothetical protein
VEADFLILADSAQVQSDKLFMLGGGWAFVWAREFPAAHPMAVAAGLIVDWLETNIRHKLLIEIRNEDTGESLWKAEGEFEQGRPPGIPNGMWQRVLVAFNLTLQIQTAGDYLAELKVNGEVLKSRPFKVGLQKAPALPL